MVLVREGFQEQAVQIVAQVKTENLVPAERAAGQPRWVSEAVVMTVAAKVSLVRVAHSCD